MTGFILSNIRIAYIVGSMAFLRPSMTTNVHLVAPHDRVVMLPELHRRYASGATIQELADELGIDRKTLTAAFIRAGLAIRGPGGGRGTRRPVPRRRDQT